MNSGTLYRSDFNWSDRFSEAKVSQDKSNKVTQDQVVSCYQKNRSMAIFCVLYKTLKVWVIYPVCVCKGISICSSLSLSLSVLSSHFLSLPLPREKNQISLKCTPQPSITKTLDQTGLQSKPSGEPVAHAQNAASSFTHEMLLLL